MVRFFSLILVAGREPMGKKSQSRTAKEGERQRLDDTTNNTLVPHRSPSGEGLLLYVVR